MIFSYQNQYNSSFVVLEVASAKNSTNHRNRSQNITVVWSQAPSIPWILRAFSILHYLGHPQKVEDSHNIHF